MPIDIPLFSGPLQVWHRRLTDLQKAVSDKNKKNPHTHFSIRSVVGVNPPVYGPPLSIADAGQVVIEKAGICEFRLVCEYCLTWRSCIMSCPTKRNLPRAPQSGHQVLSFFRALPADSMTDASIPATDASSPPPNIFSIPFPASFGRELDKSSVRACCSLVDWEFTRNIQPDLPYFDTHSRWQKGANHIQNWKFPFPSPLLRPFSDASFASSSAFQFSLFLSMHGSIVVWDPSRFFPQYVPRPRCKCHPDQLLQSDGFEDSRLIISFTGELIFLIAVRLFCPICRLNFLTTSPEIMDDFPEFVRCLFPFDHGEQRGHTLKSFNRAAQSLRVGGELSFSSIQSTHLECVTARLVDSSVASLSFALSLKSLDSLDKYLLPSEFFRWSERLLSNDGAAAHELSQSTLQISTQCFRQLDERRALYQASMQRVPCKHLKYDHTFFFVSKIRVSEVEEHLNLGNSDVSANSETDTRRFLFTPYTGCLTAMNEYGAVPYSSLCHTKSLAEKSAALSALAKRHPFDCPHPRQEYFTEIVTSDQPMIDKKIWKTMAPSASLRRDIWHCFDDLFKVCRGGQKERRAAFMLNLSKIFFIFRRLDVDKFVERETEKYIKSGEGGSIGENGIDPQRIHSFKENLRLNIPVLLRSQQVRLAIRPRSELKRRLSDLIDEYIKVDLFKSAIEDVRVSIERQIDDGYYDSFPICVPIDSDPDFEAELPPYALTEWIDIGTKIPKYISTRSTSQLENLHQVIHHLIAGITSPRHADLLLLCFIFRWNIVKQNQTKVQQFLAFYCPKLYDIWWRLSEEAAHALEFDPVRDLNPIRFQLWDKHPETGEYPLSELSIEQHRADPSTHIGAWSYLIDSSEQAMVQNHLNSIKERVLATDASISPADANSIDDKIHQFIRDNRTDHMRRFKRSGATSDLTEERLALSNSSIETAPALSRPEKLLIESLLIHPAAVRSHRRRNSNSKSAPKKKLIASLSDCRSVTDFVSFYNSEWICQSFNTLVVNGYSADEFGKLVIKPIEFDVWFPADLERGKPHPYLQHCSFNPNEFSVKNVFHIRDYLKRIGERKIHERMEHENPTPDIIRRKRKLDAIDRTKDFAVHKKLKFEVLATDAAPKATDAKRIPTDAELPKVKKECPACSRKKHVIQPFLKDGGSYCPLLAKFCTVNSDSKLVLKPGFSRKSDENKHEAARRLWYAEMVHAAAVIASNGL